MTKARPDHLLYECQGCWKRKPVTYLKPFRGLGLYCWRCRNKIEAIAETVCDEPKKRYYKDILPGEPPVEQAPRAPRLVKWWDSKSGEWRWVAKRSKPELKIVSR